MTITLSDNKPIDIRKLGLFELDVIGGSILDDTYHYEMTLVTGETAKMPYVLSEIAPERPNQEKDTVEPDSREYHLWANYETYQAAVAHRQDWIKSVEDKQAAIAQYILDTCINRADVNRILTAEDWQIVQAAAIVPQLTMEDIETTVSSIFRGYVEQRTVT